MENQDKIFERFKEIASEAESKEFPAMEKVWSRVEDKLDYKAVKKSAGIWKVIAIAASLLLLLTIGYQFLSTEKIPAAETETKVAATPDESPKVITETPPVIQKETNKPQTYTEIAVKRFPEPKAADPIVADVVVATTDFATEIEDEHPVSHIAATQPESELQTISGSVSDNTGALPGANVVVMGTTRVTQTDVDGKYRIKAKEGEKLVFSFIGMKDIVATVGDQKRIDAKLPEGDVLLESVVVNGNRNSKNATKKTRNSYLDLSKTEKTRVLKSPAYNDLSDIENADADVRTTIEFTTNSPTLYIIDGKPATEEQFKQLKTDEIATMKLLSQTEANALYGNKAVNGAMVVSKKAAKNAGLTQLDDESFENAFESPAVAPLSTFKLNVETGSYVEIRNYINKGKKVPKEVVRIEEMINYFEYRYPQPDGQNPVGIHTEYSSCPWNSKHKLLKVGVQGRNTETSIVKDAKIQVEFNPTIVKGYRLIGYEKRQLRPEDFKNNQLGSFPAGHTVTALYEIIPNGVDSQYFDDQNDAAFTKINTGTTFKGELANIKFRYQRNTDGKSVEIVKPIANKAELLQNSSNDFRFCAAVAWFGLKLRQSALIGNHSYAELLKLAKGSVTADSEGSRGEFIRLVEAVK